ncbi:peptide chain release factor N(5)-glutamine methyltransferase [Stappia stellulata]|uniref:peptide chain release factor N(5)-glutamine methyltransferase n=1 Tax=Stappia stellulata TaxID=71235 RepID=UPI001CD3870A|nr:peptide chain release factor N(5)-glutamine methyltransferase [Stappia stellulata]MCA1244149.1 peptide chain release factor N(5)-glutamine methyltransferase [Stappia stellulata]
MTQGAAPGDAPETLGRLATRLRKAFRAAGLETAALDARLLAARAAGVEVDRVVLDPERPVSPQEAALAADMMAQRLAGEPVGRILGEREFWGLTFALSPETLEPRPDTETLVAQALAWCDARGGRERDWRFADIGTGTGAIAVALLSELPKAVAVAVDLSEAALATARENALRNGVGDRFHAVYGDFADALAPGFDLLVSNPPYIAVEETATLSREVRLFDPPLALFAEDNGLAAYRRIAAEAARLLVCGGAVMVEIGATQASSVCRILEAGGLEETAVFQDLGGRDRVVGGHRVAK